MDDFFRFSKNSGFWVFLVHPTVVSVLLSASVERCFVSRMRVFFFNLKIGPSEIRYRFSYFDIPALSATLLICKIRVSLDFYDKIPQFAIIILDQKSN